MLFVESLVYCFSPCCLSIFLVPLGSYLCEALSDDGLVLSWVKLYWWIYFEVNVIVRIVEFADQKMSCCCKADIGTGQGVLLGSLRHMLPSWLLLVGSQVVGASSSSTAWAASCSLI